MGGIVPKFVSGPVTYEVVETIVGGLMVEARAGSKVGVAAAGSLVCLGVATTDGQVANPGPTTDAFGNTVYSQVNVDQYVAVGGSGAIYPVTYSADCAFGQALVCTAAGKVGPAGAAPDARTVVGQCREPGGVVVATKPIGLAKITV